MWGVLCYLSGYTLIKNYKYVPHFYSLHLFDPPSSDFGADNSWQIIASDFKGHSDSWSCRVFSCIYRLVYAELVLSSLKHWHQEELHSFTLLLSEHGHVLQSSVCAWVCFRVVLLCKACTACVWVLSRELSLFGDLMCWSIFLIWGLMDCLCLQKTGLKSSLNLAWCVFSSFSLATSYHTTPFTQN